MSILTSLLVGWLFRNGVARGLLRQGKRLDIVYIRRWLREFSDLLANSDILERFAQAYRN